MEIAGIKLFGLDKYLRYKVCARLLNNTTSILDVGGDNGEFLNIYNLSGEILEWDPNTTPHTFNLTNSITKRYYDGSKFPYEDNSFDVVISLDTFEHIPREIRGTIISEMLRVSKNQVIIICPKRYLNYEKSYWIFSGMIQNILKNDDFRRYYSEHKKFRVPQPEELIGYIKEYFEDSHTLYKLNTYSYLSDREQFLMIVQFILPFLSLNKINEIFSKSLSIKSEVNNDNLYQVITVNKIK